MRPQVAARIFEKSRICRELKRLEEGRPETRLTTAGGGLGAREVLRHQPIMSQRPLTRSERAQGAVGLLYQPQLNLKFPLALPDRQGADVQSPNHSVSGRNTRQELLSQPFNRWGNRGTETLGTCPGSWGESQSSDGKSGCMPWGMPSSPPHHTTAQGIGTLSPGLGDRQRE